MPRLIDNLKIEIDYLPDNQEIIANLYLFTPGQAPFYAHVGWTRLEQAEFRNIPVTIMLFVLKPK